MSLSMRPVADFCSLVTSGGTPSSGNASYYGGEIPWLRTQEVSFNRIADTEIKITESGLKNSAAKWIPAQSVIVAMYGASAGRVATNSIPLTTNQACCNLIVNEDSDFRYLYYALLNSFEALAGSAKGAAQNNLNAAQVKEFRIPWVPKDGQSRIADRLWAIDDLIENNQRRIKLLDEAAQLIYREWFVRLRFPGHEHLEKENGLPKGWRRVSLRDIAEVNSESLSSKFSGTIKYIDIASVSPGTIEKAELMEFRDAPSRARRVVCHGDVIWSCVRPNRRSHAIVWNPEANLIASTGFAVIRPNSVPTSFLYQLVTTSEFVNHLALVAKGAAYPAVVSSDFENHNFVIPDDNLLREFDQLVKPMIELGASLRLANQRLTQARDLLLPRLFSGEIET